VLGRCPDFVAATGDLRALDRERVAIFCSVRCPGDVIIKSYDLARRLREADLTIVGGFQSPMEKEVLSILLRGTVFVVVCSPRPLDGMRIPAEWRCPLADGRLLLLSFFDGGVRRATRELAAKRNAYVALLADRILIAHAERGGKTEGLCRDALGLGKPVFTLESAENAQLI
jgi:predicted Rossmann fold nucleotide-binding protein DprA/Smf involved in DNA uptake